MLSASDRLHSRRDTLALASCVVLAIAGLFLSDHAAQVVASSLRSSLFAPLVWLQEEAALGRTSRARFTLLQADLDSAALAAQDIDRLRAENDELRQLLELSRRLGTSYLTAEVLHQPQASDGRVLLIGAGLDQNVRDFLPVVSAKGLIGAVLSVGARSSTVMTWAHPDFRASAFTADRRVAGIVAPSGGADAGEGMLEFRAASYRDTLLPGTRILSSGLGGVYPPGIPVGVVSGVAREQKGWERVYSLLPAALPATVSHVMILTGADSVLPAIAFPGDSILAALRADSVARERSADSLMRVRIADSVRSALRDSLRPPPPAATAPATARPAQVRPSPGDST